MKVPKMFIHGNLDKKIKELSDTAQNNLEDGIQGTEETGTEKQGVIIERPDYIVKQERDEKWVKKVVNYVKEIIPPAGFEINTENGTHGVFFENPPMVTLYETAIEHYKGRVKFFPFIKTIKERKKSCKAISIFMENTIYCHDKRYEDMAIELAKKLGAEKIRSDY